MKLYSINTGYFKLDGGAMFGVVPKSMWQKLNPADENNMCSWALRSLLIEDGDRLILVDTGMGDKQDAKFFGHYYLHGDDSLDRSLAKNGFSRDDITDVFHTHLHFDHCGATIKKVGDELISAFPNATLWSNKTHWNWAIYPNDREKASFLKENILPMETSGKLSFTDEPNKVFDEKGLLGSVPFSERVSIRFVNGHTRAMMLPQIKYKEYTIVYMADLLPSVAHIPLPYIMGYDMFPLTTLQEKKSFLQEAAMNNYILFFEHDAQNECCTVKATEKGIRADKLLRLSEL
ncbi:MAG: MBL fold metallo-hydrolase [Sediminibacterium sp.]|nr:MBL fold metallo-hydrolase [Sediminibacterium sp.]MBX9779418.1 MBL fold metallo-hydrolase [Chitinophagaceae bacterium]